jgi:Protein of unknown function (DUF2510)
VFDKWKAKKAAQAAAEVEVVSHKERDALQMLLDVADGRSGVADPPITLKKGERGLLVLNGAGLFESRRGPGQFVGRSQGVSIPLGHSGVRYRVGRSRGHYVQGTEEPTIIDLGTVVVTDQRVVFVGANRTTEWAFARLISIQHYEHRPWTAIAVSNRQKASGFVYTPGIQGTVRAMLEVATGLYNGEGDQLAADLHEQLREHDAAEQARVARPVPAEPAQPFAGPARLAVEELPTPVTATIGAMPLAGWYPDPSGQPGARWWDGNEWADAADLPSQNPTPR